MVEREISGRIEGGEREPAVVSRVERVIGLRYGLGSREGGEVERWVEGGSGGRFKGAKVAFKVNWRKGRGRERR